MTHLVFVSVGAALIFLAVLLMAGKPLWGGRLSGGKRFSSGTPSDTLEPRRPGAGFGLVSNWPGLALFAAGAGFLIAAAVV